MQKSIPQQVNVPNQPAARQGRGVVADTAQTEQIAQLEAMIDSSPQMEQQGQLATLMHTSPNVAAQRKQSDMMFSSPRLAAQRKTVEGISNSPLTSAQLKKHTGLFGTAQLQSTGQSRGSGLPDNLKSGIENLSGMSMDGVKVHYNSSQPAQLNAHAYAQGTDIHVAPGQEQHLPHEAWHVVQQAQGRVKPTLQAKGVPVNDDVSLESEADQMGAKALQMRMQSSFSRRDLTATSTGNLKPVQRVWNKNGDTYLWDEMLDGVTWFANEAGQMWFNIDDPAGIVEGDLKEYKRLEGQQKSWDEWNAISVRPQGDIQPLGATGSPEAKDLKTPGDSKEAKSGAAPEGAVIARHGDGRVATLTIKGSIYTITITNAGTVTATGKFGWNAGHGTGWIEAGKPGTGMGGFMVYYQALKLLPGIDKIHSGCPVDEGVVIFRTKLGFKMSPLGELYGMVANTADVLERAAKYAAGWTFL